MKAVQITQWCARFITEQVQPGDICIDATMGNGNDTILLSSLCKETGHVYAFDIQEQALAHTRQRLLDADAPQNYTLLLESHTNMDHYVQPESVSCIVFNLGYLPGGDHHLATKTNTTIEAIQAGFELLKTGGIMSICIYSGGDSGFEERDGVLEYLSQLDDRKYFIARQDFPNKKNNPPMPVFIIKL